MSQAVSCGPPAVYKYDGDGYRVQKALNGTTTLYWPSAVSGITDESNATATSWGRQVKLGGLTLWSEDTAGNGKFLFQDHLGSTRITADASGNVKDDIDYTPFGILTANYGPGSDIHYQFTGSETDTESSTTYNTFRNLSMSLGRFNRPDPYLGSYDLTNPQSLNRYAYVLNNPMIFIDPLGLTCFAPDDPEDPDGSNWHVMANSTDGQSCESGGGTWVEDDQSVDVNGGYDQTADVISGYSFDFGTPFDAYIDTFGGSGAPSNPMSNPCSQANAAALDYSKINKQGQTAQQHILANHTAGGKGPSIYIADWTGIQAFNAATLSFGSLGPANRQAPGQYVLEWNAPSLPFPLNVIWTNNIGWGQTGQPTPTNRLVVQADCKTVITSYPVTP